MVHQSDERSRSTRRLLRRPAVLVPVVAVVLAGASTAAASDWLEVLESHDEEASSVGIIEMLAGDLVLRGVADVHEVPDARAAADATGVPVPVVAPLPRGVSGEPAYLVVGAVDGTYTPSGQGPSPDAAVHFEGGPGLAAVWTRSGIPQLVVGRAVAPSTSSSSMSLEVVRDHILALLGLPDDVSISPTEVNGVPALLFVADEASLSGVVWLVDGTVTVVAGTLDSAEVLSVARNLG